MHRKAYVNEIQVDDEQSVQVVLRSQVVFESAGQISEDGAAIPDSELRDWVIEEMSEESRVLVAHLPIRRVGQCRIPRGRGRARGIVAAMVIGIAIGGATVGWRGKKLFGPDGEGASVGGESGAVGAGYDLESAEKIAESPVRLWSDDQLIRFLVDPNPPRLSRFDMAEIFARCRLRRVPHGVPLAKRRYAKMSPVLPSGETNFAQKEAEKLLSVDWTPQERETIELIEDDINRINGGG